MGKNIKFCKFFILFHIHLHLNVDHVDEKRKQEIDTNSEFFIILRI